MSMKRIYTKPSGFYTCWNLTPKDAELCAVYELLRICRAELELRIYKLLEKTIEDGEEVMDFQHYILHKGQMYQVRWQYESFEAFALKEKWPDSTGFIISFRRFGDECVALVQRDRS